uniref:transposase n=1 Tax=Halobacterium sp. (strain GN101) TaxID=88773 RepID=UPI00159EDB76|nr:transposase [Halobacterium sp. GN101]
MNDADDRPLGYLGRQADEIISEDTDWVEFATELDVSLYENRENFPDYHASRSFYAVFQAYLWATVEQESCSGIPKRLEDRPELAEAFGFDPDDLPSESTFRPVRLERRFGDLQSTVELAADQIRQIAAERGSPIGYDIFPSDTDDDEDGSLSERSEQRLLRKKGRQVLDELSTVAFPSISLPRPDNAFYDKEELLTLEAIAAIKQSAANDAGTKLGDMKNPDPDLDDPFYEDGPTGETLLEAMKEMSVDQITTVMNFALQKTYTRAKPRLRELDDYDTNVMLALDITHVAYYGGTDELVWVQGTPDKYDDERPYDWCHMFATAVIVGENTHYTVAVLPIGSTEHTDNDAYPESTERSYYIGDVARELLSTANDYVNIRMVYADREFHAADVVHALEERNLNYVIPAKRDKRIKRRCNRFDQLKRGYEDDPLDAALYVQDGYTMHGRVKHKTSNTPVETTLVILPPDEDDDTHERGSPQPFITNSEVSDEIALDRRMATKKINRYSNRGAIENTYSSIKEASAWTTSKEFEVRWFHFAFGCVVYNMWLLVDFLTQDRIGVIETRKKPRITLSRFLDWLDKELVGLL